MRIEKDVSRRYELAGHRQNLIPTYATSTQFYDPFYPIWGITADRSLPMPQNKDTQIRIYHEDLAFTRENPVTC